MCFGVRSIEFPIFPTNKTTAYPPCGLSGFILIKNFSYLSWLLKQIRNIRWYLQNHCVSYVSPAKEKKKRWRRWKKNGKFNFVFLWVCQFCWDLAKWEKRTKYMKFGAFFFLRSLAASSHFSISFIFSYIFCVISKTKAMNLSYEMFPTSYTITFNRVVIAIVIVIGMSFFFLLLFHRHRRHRRERFAGNSFANTQ